MWLAASPESAWNRSCSEDGSTRCAANACRTIRACCVGSPPDTSRPRTSFHASTTSAPSCRAAVTSNRRKWGSASGAILGGRRVRSLTITVTLSTGMGEPRSAAAARRWVLACRTVIADNGASRCSSLLASHAIHSASSHRHTASARAWAAGRVLVAPSSRPSSTRPASNRRAERSASASVTSVISWDTAAWVPSVPARVTVACAASSSSTSRSSAGVGGWSPSTLRGLCSHVVPRAAAWAAWATRSACVRKGRFSGLVRRPGRPSLCEMVPQCLVGPQFHAAGEGVDDLLGSLKG
jgi:hypothetical protein